MYHGFGEFWGCPGNMYVDCSEDGGCSSSLINDVKVKQSRYRLGVAQRVSGS